MNGARELEGSPPEVEEEPPRSATAKQEEAKRRWGRRVHARSPCGSSSELKEDGETAAGGSSAGSADAEGSSYRFVLICII